MKYVAKPPTVVTVPKDKIAEDPTSDISVARLIDDVLLAIHREVKNLLILSSHGKLDAASSRDLRDTAKLLFELKDREGESLRGLTDEQLEAQVKEVLSNGKD